MNRIFKTGEVVELKSGGPQMTVERMTADGEVRCSWFDGGKVSTHLFPPDALRVVSDSEDDPFSDRNESGRY